MAFQPNTSRQGDRLVTETRELTRYHMHTFHFENNPNDGTKTKLIIDWSEGYIEGTKYMPVIRHTDTFRGVIIFNEMSAVTGAGQTRYSAVKEAAWKILLESGKLPSDGEVI